ncbi:MAG: M16 family metallopeptidase [Candidatus Aminicenantales bacterium]
MRNLSARERRILTAFLFISLLGPQALYAQEKFRRSPPFPQPLRLLKLPEIESVKLSNGLKVALVRREGLPLLTMQLIVLSGESSSPEGKSGVATITARMFPKGAENLTSSKVDEIIEYIGGKVTTAAYGDYSVFTLTFLEEYLEVALDMLSRMILRPSFLRREIDAEKRNIFFEIREREKDPSYLGKKHLLQLLFEGHPYAKVAFREDSLKNIYPRDILQFFRRYYRPENCILLFQGDLNLNTAVKKTSHYLNLWKGREKEITYLKPPEACKKKRVAFVDLPGAKEATVFLGNVIYTPSRKEYFPLFVLNQVLGGTPNSRLFLNLRESKEYAYFAFSEVELFRLCSVFIIRARVRPKFIFLSVEECLKEIEKILREEISSFEIEQAKSYLLGNFPLNIENLDDFSRYLSKILAFDIGSEFWTRYYENIMSVSTEKVFEIVQNYPFATPVIVVVGDKENIMDYLSDFEEIEIYDSKGIFQYLISKGVEE